MHKRGYLGPLAELGHHVAKSTSSKIEPTPGQGQTTANVMLGKALLIRAMLHHVEPHRAIASQSQDEL